uniref:Uncharacterized protein n=1 Tax=Romanomermis culicivorax TaxID=13658 RepID=A0A915JIZ2_ROMCU
MKNTPPKNSGQNARLVARYKKEAGTYRLRLTSCNRGAETLTFPALTAFQLTTFGRPINKAIDSSTSTSPLSFSSSSLIRLRANLLAADSSSNLNITPNPMTN